MRMIRAASLLALCATLTGCVAALTAIGSSSTAAAAAHAAAGAMAAGAGPVALGVGAVAIGGTSGDPQEFMVGMSRANVESCAGFHGRDSEQKADGLEHWTYQRRECRVSLSFKDGYVSKVSYSEASSDCSELLALCRRRQR